MLSIKGRIKNNAVAFLATLLALPSAWSAGLVQQIPPREYETLVAFYNATDGTRWHDSSGWLDPAAENWLGVTVEGVVLGPSGEVITQGHVIALVLPVNNLTGLLPAQLDELTYLEALILGVNILTGPIPPSLGNLQRLTELNLSYTSLRGRIPPELGNLTSLQYLDLSGTPLTGPLPRELGNLAALRSLSLRNTLINGSLPPELGNLRNLQFLDLNNSKFTGSIPPELGNLAELLSLDFNINRFTGEIPPDLERLTKLVVLKLAQNQLTGSIPVSLSRLDALIVLALGLNNLTGSIPPELGNLGNLQSLDLTRNQLTGSIPDDLGRLTHLGGLSLADNQLTGSVPQSLGGLPEIQFIDLSFNNLSGDIPDHFTSTRLFSMNFERNNFDLTPGSRFQQAIERLRAEGTPVKDRPQNGPNRLLNISGRARVGGEERVLIAGFTLRAPLYGRVTVRGLGPSLLQNGLNNPLPDPFLALHGVIGGLPQTIVENDDWRMGLTLMEPALEPRDDREAGISQAVDAGSYTAILSGKNGAQGVALVDIFSPDNFFESELVNLSIRGLIGTGDDVLIGGFIIGPLGPGSTTIVLRGIGPSLSRWGISEPLQDPVLELRDANGDLLALNDNWNNGSAEEIRKVGLAPEDERESALIVEVGPGPYTAILRGANETAGIGLLEVYNISK